MFPKSTGNCYYGHLYADISAADCKKCQPAPAEPNINTTSLNRFVAWQHVEDEYKNLDMFLDAGASSSYHHN